MRQEARELLELLEGCARLEGVGRAMFRRLGFYVYPGKGQLFVRPPEPWPSYHDLIGEDASEVPLNQLRIRSRKRLIEYLEKALALPDGFKTEEEVRKSLGLSRDGALPTPQKSQEPWYQARLLCFWDEDELKKPFGDRTPRPFETTIRMLKAEAAKGHCFLGFAPEIHHEFNY